MKIWALMFIVVTLVVLLAPSLESYGSTFSFANLCPQNIDSILIIICDNIKEKSNGDSDRQGMIEDAEKISQPDLGFPVPFP